MNGGAEPGHLTVSRLRQKKGWTLDAIPGRQSVELQKSRSGESWKMASREGGSRNNRPCFGTIKIPIFRVNFANPRGHENLNFSNGRTG